MRTDQLSFQHHQKAQNDANDKCLLKQANIYPLYYFKFYFNWGTERTGKKGTLDHNKDLSNDATRI